MKGEEIGFFPQREAEPKIYAYELKGVASHNGYIKVGYTTRSVKERVEEQTKTAALDYRIIGEWSAMRRDGSGESFSDHDVHDILVRQGFSRKGEEWFKCSLSDVEAAILAVQTGTENEEKRTRDFPMREEQSRAVEMTKAYFESVEKEDGDRKDPKFLWNAKMRFGKTFATYQLAKAMDMKRVLVLTFKPAVQSAWREDLLTHIDFEKWQFICAPSKQDGKTIDEQYKESDKAHPIVCFGSFQDFLGEDNGRIKPKNKWVHEINWDLIVFDEYHFGAWRDTAKKLFAQDEDVYELDIDETSEKFKSERVATLDETWLPITANHYLYLSGTPFRALNSGEFMEEQIFNWTYSDEQRAKAEWNDEGGKSPNPYAALPRMVMLAYKVPKSISNIAEGGEFDEFDLNEFFAPEGSGDEIQFKHKENVQKWLDLIRGAHLETAVDDLKLGAKKPAMPFSDTRLLNVLSHTLWFMPDVASCVAMRNLLAERQNKFYHDFEVIVCAGNAAGMGAKALEPVKAKMGDALKTKTITLSCGKLMTGVTVRPWTGIFMLRNLKSPETYFQAAFRVQSPWEVIGDDGKKEIIKKECYVFDFALDRALRQISDYSCNLDVNETNPEKKVADFIQFLPVLAYDGSAMRRVDAGQILDMAMSGTSATMLARKWESALLVNVDNFTLERIIGNKDAMDAILKIEGFRGLNLKGDIETIINKSEKVKQAKRENLPQTRKEKEELSEDEKEYKSKRKLIQEKLIKFATRIPVFMYLTDAREMCLKEVITNVEPDLFKKVTGLEIKDFELLVSLNVFNESRMNEAVYYFKRYEDPSICYAGIDKHKNDERVGLFSTSISKAAYEEMAGQNKQDDDDEGRWVDITPESITLDCFRDGDWVHGVEWARDTDMTNPRIQYYMGHCYEFGLGVEKDEVKAFEWYSKAANNGDAEGQCSLGVCYELGKGVETNSREAFKWYKKSAGNGNAMGQCCLGAMYEYGTGTEVDLEEAFRWYEMAANNNDELGQYYLGCMYEYGKGTRKDPKKALEWYKKSAENGYACAQYCLGLCYEYGQGTEKDRESAIRWYKTAAENGDKDAQKRLGLLEDSTKNDDIDDDDVEEMSSIDEAMQAFENKHWAMGMVLAEKTDLADARIQYYMGYCYENGLGTGKDYDKAKMWYAKAGEQGHEEAMRRMEMIGREGESDDPSNVMPELVPKKRKPTGAWGSHEKKPSDVLNWKERGGKRSGKRTYRDSLFWKPSIAELETLVSEELPAKIEEYKAGGDTCQELLFRGKLRNAEDELAWRKGDDGRRMRKRNLRDWFGNEYRAALEKYGAMSDKDAQEFMDTLYGLFTSKKYVCAPVPDVSKFVSSCYVVPELWQVRWQVLQPGEEDREFAVRYRNQTNRFEEFYKMIGGCDPDGVSFAEISEGDTVTEWVIEHPKRPKELIEIEQKEMAAEAARLNSPEGVARRKAEDAEKANAAWDIVQCVVRESKKGKRDEKKHSCVVPISRKAHNHLLTGLTRTKFFDFDAENLRMALSAKVMKFVVDDSIQSVGHIIDSQSFAEAVWTGAVERTSRRPEVEFVVRSVHLRVGKTLYSPRTMPLGVIPDKIVVTLGSQI